ncbi:MAG: twin transmembrane helix small protein [Rhizomicrobium sp.]
MTGKIIVIVALAAVAIILFAGIATMWIGGETAGKWSNRLMRYRVVAQAIAIAIILLVLYATSPH